MKQSQLYLIQPSLNTVHQLLLHLNVCGWNGQVVYAVNLMVDSVRSLATSFWDRNGLTSLISKMEGDISMISPGYIDRAWSNNGVWGLWAVGRRNIRRDTPSWSCSLTPGPKHLHTLSIQLADQLQLWFENIDAIVMHIQYSKPTVRVQAVLWA